jgi:hypothetical protein
MMNRLFLPIHRLSIEFAFFGLFDQLVYPNPKRE